ncbi:hypothetical protein ScPMuIL_003196 [Solemya velum]
MTAWIRWLGLYTLTVLSLCCLSVWSLSAPPGEPIINAPAEAVEGNIIWFLCTSYGGQPRASLTWLRDDGSVLSPAFKTNYSYVPLANVAMSSHCLCAPLSPELTPTTEVVEGRENSWDCVVSEAYPPPTIFWTFRGSPITEGITTAMVDFSDMTSKLTSTLTRTFVRSESGGVLQCQVAHESSNDRPVVELQLTVNYVADMEAPNNAYDRELGDSVTLQCVIGNASPVVTDVRWYHDDQLVQTGLARYSDVSIAAPSLEISNLGVSDNGNYICSAFNGVGSSNTSAISLDVWYLPQVTVQPELSVLEGENVLLNCSVKAVPPISSVSWYKVVSGIPVPVITKVSPKLKYIVGDSSFPHLVIYDMELEDAGSYRCQVNNSKGSSTSGTIQLTMQFGPEGVSVTPDAVAVRLGEDSTVTCSASANPAPTYQWTFEGVTIETGNTLAKTSVTKQDAGEYLCVATSDDRTANAAVVIEVQYLPEISVQQTYEVDSNSEVTLLCDVDAVPMETVVWYKMEDNVRQQLSPSDVTGKYSVAMETWGLTIKNTRGSDSGSYYCEATNTVGTASSPLVQVTVTYFLQNIQVTPSSESIVEFGEFSATCSVEANPAATFVWTLDNEQVASGPVFEGESVSRAKAGSYMCEANNGGSTLATSFTLTVEYKPTPVALSYSYEMAVGDVLLLECLTDAIPPANVHYWSHRSVALAETSSVLEVTVSSDSTGLYSCSAQNTLGASAAIRFSVQLADTGSGTGTGSVGASTSSELSVGATAAVALAAIFGILVIIIIIVCCIAQGYCSGLSCFKKQETKAARVAPEKQPPIIPRFVERHSPEKGTSSIISRRDVTLSHKYHNGASDQKSLMYSEAELGREGPGYHSLPSRRPHHVGDLVAKRNAIPSITNGPIISVYDDSYNAPAPRQIDSLATPASRPNQLPALEALYNYEEEERKRKKRRKRQKKPEEEQSPERKHFAVLNGDLRSPEKSYLGDTQPHEETPSRSREERREHRKKHRKHRKHSKSKNEEENEDIERSRSRSHTRDNVAESRAVSARHRGSEHSLHGTSYPPEETVRVVVPKQGTDDLS